VCDAADDCPADPNPLQEDLDGDALGDVCDAVDAALFVERVRLRTGTAGSVTLKGRFALGLADAFDAGTGVALTVGDGVETVFHAWPAGECVPKAGGVSCRSVDGLSRVRVWPQRSLPGGYRLAAKLRRLALAGSPAGPVTVTLTESAPRIDRAGTIAACTVKATGLACRQR
jgi:hypothetical protein